MAHSMWITNRFANHFMRPLLRGPMGRRFGRHVALLRVPGRRTGRVYEFPVQYERDDGQISIRVGSPERKTWWHNVRGGGADIEVRLAGRDYRGHAVALERGDDVVVRVDLASDSNK